MPGRSLWSKDVNEDPIPDFPRGILPLGDGDGGKLIPTGKHLVGRLSPSGMAGTGMVAWSPTPIPANPPREAVKHAARLGHTRGVVGLLFWGWGIRRQAAWAIWPLAYIGPSQQREEALRAHRHRPSP